MTALSIIIIAINFIVSWKGFNDRPFYERFKFSIDRVLIDKQYYRIITSAFLHSGWPHLIWNMLSLLAFSGSIESFLGPVQFLLIYFASVIGGGLLSLFIHRNHGAYSAIGASGAVAGIIFASIALFPGMKVGFFLLPLSIPGWIYGLLYVLISIWGIQSKFDNIGHDAHLGGALVGLTTALLFQPEAFSENYPTILVIAIPTLVFMYLLATRPHILLTGGSFRGNGRRYYSVDHRYNSERADRQKEVDRILDKIARHGMSSLTKKEKETLEQHSRSFK